MANNQVDKFFKNRCFLEIREYLNLDQKGFSQAIGIHQSGISKIEMNVNGISHKTIGQVCDTFYINPKFFIEGANEPMFLEGREQDAWKVAERFARKPVGRPKEKDSTDGQNTRMIEIQAIRIEKLTSELELTKELLKSREEFFQSREEILKSKEDLILILKEQLEQANTNYEKLSKEISELKELLDQNEGGTDDPNGIHPVKSSG